MIPQRDRGRRTEKDTRAAGGVWETRVEQGLVDRVLKTSKLRATGPSRCRAAAATKGAWVKR